MFKPFLRGAFLALFHSILLSIPLSALGSDLQEAGILSAYERVPTDTTIRNRRSFGQIDEISPYDVLIAVRDCDRVGEDAMLETDEGEFYALIYDCAGIEDGGLDWMISGNYVAEVDWYFWQDHPDLIGTVATVRYNQKYKWFRLPFSLRRLPQVVRSILGATIPTNAPQKTAPGPNFVPLPYKRPTQRTQDYGPGHNGIDEAAGCGAVLLAPFDGVITHNGYDGWINTMLTVRGDRFTMTLLHGRYLPELGKTVKEVHAGDMLGYESDIGNTTGCHSHIMLYDRGVMVDPGLWVK